MQLLVLPDHEHDNMQMDKTSIHMRRTYEDMRMQVSVCV